MKVYAICSDFEGKLPPSHGFGVFLDSGVVFDSCTEDVARRFLEEAPRPPILGISAVDNLHHSGGFSAFNVPVIRWAEGVLDLRIGGTLHRVIGFGREAVLIVGRTVISPCGLFTIPFGKLSRMGLRADCFVGGLGGSTASPYAVSRVLGELRALGVRCVAPLHSPPGIVREVERRFNVYRLGAGSALEIPI
ncbi:MAG: hypothetical protein ACP5HD_04460 [Thermoproteus sp.]